MADVNHASSRKGGGKAGAMLFIVIGIVALAIGAWQGWTTMRFIGRAKEVTGIVVARVGDPPGRMSSAHPTVEFRDVTGATVRYRQNGMGSRPIGETMTLLYDPVAPADTAVTRGFWTLWFPVLGPLLLGLAFMALPLTGAQIGSRGARP